MKRILLIILGVLIIMGGVALIKKRQRELEQTPLPKRPVASFHVRGVVHGTMPVREHYSGTLLAEQTVSLAPQVQGRILAIHRSEGEKFSKGDILIHIDDREIRQEISAMDAEINRAESEFRLQQTIFKRKKSLFENNAIAQQAMDEADAAYKQSRHRLESLKAQSAAVRTRLKYTKIQAPFDGVVIQQFQEPGDMAIPGKPILKLENPDKGYKVLVRIPTRLAASVVKGTEALLVSQGDYRKATVSKVLPSINDGTSLGVIEVFIKKRPFGLPSGSSLGVDLTVGRPRGFIVPERAVLIQKEAAHVYVLGPENTIVPVKIQVLGWAGKQAVVSGDLHEKDKVVVADESRLLGLSAGQKIRPLPEEVIP